MWLFGSGKKKSQPEVYVSETTVEGFSQVNTRLPQEPPSPTSNYQPPIPPYPAYPTLPYNLIPQTPYPPTRFEPKVRPPANPLDSIPFQIVDEHSLKNRLFNEVKLAKDVLDKIQENIQSNTYDYDFNLEKSVIQEVDSSKKNDDVEE